MLDAPKGGPRESSSLRALPSVDEVLRAGPALAAAEIFGRPATIAEARRRLAALRAAAQAGTPVETSPEYVAAATLAALEAGARPRVRRVFNLTGTVLHTNLGRAVLAEAAVEAAVTAMREAVPLEFDVDRGNRGERDHLIRDLLVELTGAEDATVVNNNAAALMIVLNTLAAGREAIVSRGEMIEIGGAFRLPAIMAQSGVHLHEIGTTNRTHLRDYREAISEATGLVLKVHTSNFEVRGFTASVPAKALTEVAREAGVPLVNDLGSGTLVDLTRWGLAHEPTVREAVSDGADLVTFSGDKLLGGPQAGFVVGRRELIARVNKNPMKRAMRVDKIRLAAIEATLRLYLDPDRLAERLPTMRMLARPQAEIARIATRLVPAVAAAVGADWRVDTAPCGSQIGSGALPLSSLPSAAVRLSPLAAKGKGALLLGLAASFRRLPVPVIGRIEEDAFWLDCRCLEDEPGFAGQLGRLETA